MDSAAPQFSSSSECIISSASTASPSTRTLMPVGIQSPVSTRLSPALTRLSPARYVYTDIIRTSTFSALTRTWTHSDSFDSTFQDPFFDENINSPYSVAAGHSSESESAPLPASEAISTTLRKKTVSKETYNIRKKLLSVESERIQMMVELKKKYRR